MPINSIISQPASGSLNSAYRPIVFVVSASATNSDPIPPVVYCDVYLNGSYYKTYSATICKSSDNTSSLWQFDIQDALQEYLRVTLPENGGKDIIQISNGIATVLCKFRSSGIDTNGLIAPEGTIPVQGTGNTQPTPGTGTASNTFYVVNAALQHANNQALPLHLNANKRRSWLSTAWPLTHRPDMEIGVRNSDYFAVATSIPIHCLRVQYKVKGASNFTTATKCELCLVEVINLSVSLDGDGKFVLAWTNLSGTPYFLLIEYSTDGGATFSDAGGFAIINASKNGATIDDTLDTTVDYIWRVVPFCGVNLPGIGTIANYYHGTPPATNVITLVNSYSLAYSVTRLLQDGVNIPLAPLATGASTTVNVPGIGSPHKFGCRVLPNTGSQVLSQMVHKRGSTVLNTFEFVPSLPDPVNTAQWTLANGDIIEIKEAE